jgi:hypothetical protein
MSPGLLAVLRRMERNVRRLAMTPTFRERDMRYPRDIYRPADLIWHADPVYWRIYL